MKTGTCPLKTIQRQVRNLRNFAVSHMNYHSNSTSNRDPSSPVRATNAPSAARNGEIMHID